MTRNKKQTHEKGDKVARPRKEIDKKQFENLCGLHCTKQEICDWFELTDKTLEKWCKRTYGKGFSEIYREKRSNGNLSLRRKQMEVALAGNVSMLIFLGKNYLGQTDKVEQTITTITEEAKQQVEDIFNNL